MKWECQLIGKINTIDGKVRTVNRYFDGSGDVVSKARECLAKRKDKGAPWYGDAVMVITPLSQRVIVDIPWPGEEDY